MITLIPGMVLVAPFGPVLVAWTVNSPVCLAPTDRHEYDQLRALLPKTGEPA